MKYTQNMSFADIENAIPLLAKRGARFRADVQSLITSVAAQWYSSGNVAHAAKLMTRIASEIEGYYGQAITDYVEGVFGFKWNKDVKGFVYTETKLEAETLKDIKQGKIKPFWEYSPPKDIKGKDLVSLLQKLLADNAKYSASEVHAKREAEGRKDNLIPLDVAQEIKAALARQAA
jgi:hypothetical protein